MWSEMTKEERNSTKALIVFLKSTTSNKKKLFSMFSLCVSCYSTGWKGSLSHVAFWLSPWWDRAQPMSWLWVGVLEKSLKSVKYKTKSMSISLSVSLPVLLPHICPLLLSSFLTPPRDWGTSFLSTRVELDMKAPQGDHILDHVMPCINSTSRLRQRLALLCTGGVVKSVCPSRSYLLLNTLLLLD